MIRAARLGVVQDRVRPGDDGGVTRLDNRMSAVLATASGRLPALLAVALDLPSPDNAAADVAPNMAALAAARGAAGPGVRRTASRPVQRP